MYLQYPQDVLEKLQNEERCILKDVHDFCKEHDINYFAIGGTLIGAVRHRDFIPWDDDVDLGMLREDFDKFVSLFDRFPAGYELCTPDTENRYYSFVPKLAKKGTLFMTDLADRSDVRDMGIFVEIFVFENVSADPKERQKQIRRVINTKILFNAHQVKRPVTFGSKPVIAIKNVVKFLLKGYTHIAGLTQEKLNQRYLDQTVSKEETGYAAYFGDSTTEDFLTKKADLFPLQEVPFGADTIMIPSNYDQLLKQAYGDYMTIPPVEGRWNQAPLKIRFSDQTEVDFR